MQGRKPEAWSSLRLLWEEMLAFVSLGWSQVFKLMIVSVLCCNLGLPVKGLGYLDCFQVDLGREAGYYALQRNKQ
jgi:hypothetical protein